MLHKLLQNAYNYRDDLVHANDINGCTLLHHACILGDVSIIKMLLKNQSDSNARTTHGTTPLMFAVASNNINAARYLLHKGATTHKKNKYGSTVFSLANTKEMKTLLSQYNVIAVSD